MGLIWADDVIGLLKTFRAVHLDGKYGGHKTSLAVMLCYELLRHGEYKRMISNFPCVWRDRPVDIQADDHGRIDTVAIVDEGGLFIETAKQAKKFMIALRKLNVIVIIPSITPPSSRLRFITIQQVMHFGFIGLPLVLFKWSLKKGYQTDTGYFLWWRPSEVYGLFGTERGPMHDAGIAGLLGRFAQRLNVHDDGYLYDTELLGVTDDEAGSEDGGGWAILEAAESLQTASEGIGKAVAVGRRRR